MKRVIIAITVLAALLAPAYAAAQNAPAPELETILPDILPSTGGVEVIITGKHLNLPPNWFCFAECPPRVRFDDYEVAAHEYTDTRIAVKAPPHAAGLVGITVTTPDGRVVSRPAAVTYEAAAPSFWDTLLVPIYVDRPTPGSDRSLWLTELTFRNHSDSPVRIAPWPCPPNEVCLPVYPPERVLLPGELRSGLPPATTATGNPGRLLYVQARRPGDVTFSLRVLDGARPVSGAGTEIPVVGEKDFRSTTAHLLNVPFDRALYRYALRIYELSRLDTRFHVKVYSQNEQRADRPLTEVIVTARQTDPDPSFPSEPGYATIDLATFIAPGGPVGPVRIEVQPLDPFSRFWTFVSITSVESQQVTIVTP